jgi:hypothetical protein
MECTWLINSSFHNLFIFNFSFNVTVTYFLSPHFSFFLFDKHNVIISKFHYKSIIVLEFVQKNYDDSH